jgi:hypothetical protein
MKTNHYKPGELQKIKNRKFIDSGLLYSEMKQNPEKYKSKPFSVAAQFKRDVDKAAQEAKIKPDFDCTINSIDFPDWKEYAK